MQFIENETKTANRLHINSFEILCMVYTEFLYEYPKHIYVLLQTH